MSCKILIINQGGGEDNFGDDAILAGMSKILFDQGHQYRHVRFSKTGKKSLGSALKIDRFEFMSRFTKRKNVFFKPFKSILLKIMWLKRNFKRIKQECVRGEVDIAMIGGGELIQSNGIFPLALWVWTFFLNKKAKIPCFLLSVGVGEHIYWIDKLLIKHSSKRIKRIFVRDKRSLHRWNLITGDTEAKVQIAYDPAFILPGKFKGYNKKRCLVLFSPTSYKFYNAKCFDKDKMNEDSYISYWLNLINKHIYTSSDVALISTNNSQDPPFHSYLAYRYHEQFGGDVRCIQVDTLEDFRQYLAESKTIVSGRLHALILGYVQGVKIIPFFTSSKVRYHYESIFKENVSLQYLNKTTSLAIKTCCSFAGCVGGLDEKTY